ncbi:MAG: DMT family transporter [Anaerolineales bacterium]
MPIQAVPYVLALGFFFGSTVLASRFSVGQFAPMTYVALRLILAGFGHALFYLLSIQGKRWPQGKHLWQQSALLAVFGTIIPMNFIVISLQYQSSGVTSMLITLNPAVTVVLANFFLEDEKLNRRKIAGVLLALSGATMMLALGESGLPDVEQANPLGYLLVFVAMLSTSSASIFARKKMRALDSFDVSSIRMWVSASVVLPLSFLFFGFDLSRVNSQGVFTLGWAALTGTFLGMMLSFYITKRFGATSASMTAYVIPVVATLGGALLLDEKITWGIIAGMVLIFGGIALINWSPRPDRVVV